MPDTDTSRVPSPNPSFEAPAFEDPASEETEPPSRHISLGRSILVGLILLALVLMAVLPPLVNVNRFKRRIVTSISTSIGRPVHLDSVSLLLLPVPAFKLENFVVEEDPAFGSEPLIHANNVVATLRVSSLWRRKVEFSKISLQEPHINVVRDAQARWNIESLLLQAARIPVAPTAQAQAGPDPRFPYIEATGARVNIKSGNEKLPFSFTEADFALWLPGPQQWRLRMEAKPTRTDTSASDTGTVSLEGALGRAEHFDLIPLDLSGEWKNAPLGEASRVLTGHDVGLRGDLRLNIAIHGTVGNNLVKTSLELRNARRADFVPDHPLDLRAECQATSSATFHGFHDLRCSWPSPSVPAMLALTGDIPDIRHLDSASFEIGSPGLPAAELLSWLRVASKRVPPDVIATGRLTGAISATDNSLSGQIKLAEAALSGGPIGDTAIKIGDISIASNHTSADASSRKNRTTRHKATPASAIFDQFTMSALSLPLGGKEPATLDGHFDRNGYTLHLTGNVLPSRLLALGAAIPQFGDGLATVLPSLPATTGKDSSTHTQPPAPIHVDLTSTRTWLGGQSWSATTSAKPPRKTHR